LERQSSKKSIDELADKLHSFEIRHSRVLDKLLKANRQEEETEEEKNKRLELRAKSMDPRVRYQENKIEMWAHPSCLADDCDEQNEELLQRAVTERDEGLREALSAELDRRRCKHHVCGMGEFMGNCIPECPYYPDEGLETWDGKFTYPNTEEYERAMKEWWEGKDKEEKEKQRQQLQLQ
jgi:hypothetical protein